MRARETLWGLDGGSWEDEPSTGSCVRLVVLGSFLNHEYRMCLVVWHSRWKVSPCVLTKIDDEVNEVDGVVSCWVTDFVFFFLEDLV